MLPKIYQQQSASSPDEERILSCLFSHFPSSKEQLIAEVFFDDISAMPPSRVKPNIVLGSWDGGASNRRGGASGQSRVLGTGKC